MQFAPEQKNIKQAVMQAGVKAALNNTGTIHLICLFAIRHYQHLKCCSVGACSPLFALVSPTDAQPGVMRHGLNAAYYANQNKPIRAIQEAGAAVRDAITGSRQ